MSLDIYTQRFVKAPVKTVWAALTEAEAITAFHPAGMQAKELKEGGIELVRPDDGSTFIREALVNQKPLKSFELTFEPVWAEAPDEASTVLFEVQEDDGVTQVTLSQTNCSTFGIGNNWDRFLDSMKSYVETGAGLRANT